MGLRERRRDAELPALAEQAYLRPPDASEAAELVALHLRRPDAAAIEGCTWDYARWKPGVSITCVYTVRFADGSAEPVVVKRYVDGKDRSEKLRPPAEGELDALSPRLVPRVLVPERSLSLWVPAADRVLRGLPVLLDRRKLGRLVTRAGIAPAGAIRKRRTEYTLLRYKPERRAVYRIDMRLRIDEPRELAVAARVLPPAEAARVAGARAALERAGGRELAPSVAGANLRRGVLLERWLALASCAPGHFGHAREAGAQLARLHALRVPRELRRLATGSARDLERLFAVDASLARLPRAPPHPPPERLVFCHGDLHPDQLARLGDDRWLLMDLDLLGAGDPAFDLASWAADWIVEHERADLEAAAGGLLEGYRSAGGRAPGRERLAAFTAAELVRRAGSCIRRLEQGAVEKARFALVAAQSLT